MASTVGRSSCSPACSLAARRFNGTVAAHSYTNASAPVHVVIGMAGCDEGLTPSFVSPVPAWSANRAAQLGYAALRFDSATSMTLEYRLSTTGTTADAITLTQPTAEL